MNEVQDRILPFKRKLSGFLLMPGREEQALFLRLWPASLLEWSVFDFGARAIEFLFTEPPDLLIVNNQMPDIPGLELVNLMKSENVYRQLPVILCVDPEDLAQGLNWGKVEADDFLLKPFTQDEARARISLTMSRASRSMDANPLTRLPGNTSIIQRLQEMIDSRLDFALAYADLDYFKSFNDRYGFSRGDEALQMTARLIVNTIREFRGGFSFVGHVGGDDYVFILPPEDIELACQRIIQRFDAIVPNFYDPEDLERGGIHSVDRQGIPRDFPLMAISIAVVVNQNGRLKHFGEASAISMALKKKAKENPKSCYVIDRRAYDPTA